MRTMGGSRILLGVTPMLMVCGVLLSGTSALAQSDQPGRRCSNRTLSGDYGAQIIGTIVGPDLTVRAVAMAHYDGNGNFTQVDFAVVQGVPQSTEWRPGAGTYTVNPDCTGTAVVNTPNSPVPLNLSFVVTDKGHEIREVLDSNALVTVCRRVR